MTKVFVEQPRHSFIIGQLFSEQLIDELVELLVQLLPLGVHLASPLQQLQQQAYLGHLLLALHRLSVTC